MKVMLADERIESMRMMYELFRRIEGGTKQMMDTVCFLRFKHVEVKFEILIQMSKYLRDRGNKIVEEAFGGNGARAVNRNNEDVDEQPGTSEGTAVNQPKPVEFVKVYSYDLIIYII